MLACERRPRAAIISAYLYINDISSPIHNDCASLVEYTMAKPVVHAANRHSEAVVTLLHGSDGKFNR